MTDQELLQAIGQVVESKMEPMQQDIRSLKEDFQGLKGEVQGLKEDVRALQNQYNGLEAKVDRLEEQVSGIRVYIDTDLQRTLNLLLEGQQALWDRFVPQEEFDPLKDRTQVLEMTVKRHSKEIRELRWK